MFIGYDHYDVIYCCAPVRHAIIFSAVFRFCSLKLDQATLAGSHNAGSGFDGGFGFLSCWVRNQYMTVLEQLRFGVRYLDVDTSWEHCGLLGTFHNFACGGPLCRMIKQVRTTFRFSVAFRSQRPYGLLLVRDGEPRTSTSVFTPWHKSGKGGDGTLSHGHTHGWSRTD